MDSGFLNSLVGDYLSSVSSKLADKFKKETKATPLPPNSPSIAEMVNHFKETTPKVSKRKLAMTNGDSAAKKAKKDESSSDDSDSDDDNKNKKPVAKAAKAAPAAAPVEKMEESSSDESDSEDEKPAAKPAAAAPKAAKKVAKKESSSEDSSDSEDEKPAAKPAPKAATPAKAAPKAAAKKEESSSDDSDSEDEKPAAKTATPAAKPAPKAAAKKEESSSDDSDSDEEEKPAAKAKAATPAKAAPKKKESSSEDSDSEDEKPAPKKATPAPKAAAKKEESSSDSDSDSEDEKPAPKAKAAAKPAKKESSDSDDSSSDDDEPAPKKAAKEAPAEAMDEDEPVMTVKSNKNKTLDDLKTPTKSHDQSYGGGDKSFNEEGRKIFIHNVSEEATYEDFQAEVEKHGEVTDFFNPGRGFGFITFSANEEAQACIKAMDNTEISGRTIQMNIARPKGEKPAPGTGGKRQEAAPGCKLFVHGITQETDNSSLQSAFEAHGTVMDAYNPGKGFAFVTFSKSSEANAAMAAFEGTEVCGCYVTINVARDKKDAGAGGRGGARGGRGGGGGGGRREDIEGAKLFVHNVSEDTEQQDLWNAFAEHGTVTDAYNPGRGFAFVTFASAEDAQKAMGALEGQEVCGREIQCNVAKPREAKTDGGGRGGGRGGARGGARGGGRGGRGGMSISAGAGGGNNKKISFD